MPRHRHVWKLLFREGRTVAYLSDNRRRVAIYADVLGCECGKRKRVKPRASRPARAKETSR